MIKDVPVVWVAAALGLSDLSLSLFSWDSEYTVKR